MGNGGEFAVLLKQPDVRGAYFHQTSLDLVLAGIVGPQPHGAGRVILIDLAHFELGRVKAGRRRRVGCARDGLREQLFGFLDERVGWVGLALMGGSSCGLLNSSSSSPSVAFSLEVDELPPESLLSKSLNKSSTASGSAGFSAGAAGSAGVVDGCAGSAGIVGSLNRSSILSLGAAGSAGVEVDGSLNRSSTSGLGWAGAVGIVSAGVLGGDGVGMGFLAGAGNSLGAGFGLDSNVCGGLAGAAWRTVGRDRPRDFASGASHRTAARVDRAAGDRRTWCVAARCVVPTATAPTTGRCRISNHHQGHCPHQDRFAEPHSKTSRFVKVNPIAVN